MSQSDAGAAAREKAEQAKAAAEDGKDTMLKKLEEDGVYVLINPFRLLSPLTSMFSTVSTPKASPCSPSAASSSPSSP